MPNNIIMADSRGGAGYETVSLPNAVTNGENLKTTIDSMNLPPLSLIVTTKNASDVSLATFTFCITGQNGKIQTGFRWENDHNASKTLSSAYDFKANEGDEFYIIPCPQT